MEGDTGSGSVRPDEWASAVTSGDAAKLAKLVLISSGSMPEPALLILQVCASLLETKLAFSTPAFSQWPPTPDEWGLAVAIGDATKLAELVLVWSGSIAERAHSLLTSCISLLEKEVAFSAPASSPLQWPPSSLGPTRLDALIVSLNETREGKSWYKSTKELQLASLELCIACRTCQTMHLKVDAPVPRRLLAAADAPPPHPKRLCWTRVPPPRARRVTWNMPTAAELRIPILTMTNADCLEFGRLFKGSLEAVAWPRRVKAIKFHRYCNFEMPIDLVEWPASLQRLVFRNAFNQPIERANFPASLQELEVGDNFMHPINDVRWPPSLRRLSFGGFSDQPIEDVVWPTSLKQLAFGQQFNQPIEGVVWPDSLLKIHFGDSFNRPIDNVRWPASLQEVTFGGCSDSQDNDRRDKWMLRLSLFNQRIGSSVWPASLRRLNLGGNFRQSLQGLGTWMPNLEGLDLFDGKDIISLNDSLLQGIEWPKSLRELNVFFESSLDGVQIPPTVMVHPPRWV